ncbi:MAG: MotA/TolQ/ExbB proton channel family protein [Lentisphaerota bacterium]
MKRTILLCACAALLTLTALPLARAQTAEATGSGAGVVAAAANERSGPVLMPVPQSGMSLREAWRCGGWIMWVLAGGSVIGLALSLYLFWTLRTSQMAPPSLLSELLMYVKSGDLATARRVCEVRSSPLARIAMAAFDHLRNTTASEPALLRADVEAEGIRQAEAIQGETQLLLDLSVIAPMLGLLGTVMGMLKAFGSVATDVASAKPVVLAAGVSQAIVTTIFGLLVAIPAMVAYAYFRRRASRQIAALEAASTALVTAVTSRFER